MLTCNTLVRCIGSRAPASRKVRVQPKLKASLAETFRSSGQTQKELERDADRQSIRFATQSGPMLVIEGQINSEFKIGSSNLYIRNGVCILENGRVIFAISRRKVNFYDFAAYFKNAGCRNALYLDGFVSRMYAPESNITETDGDFGVIIGIAE